MLDKNKAVVCCLLATSAIMLSEKKKIMCKMWIKKWYLEMNISCNAHLLNELLETDVEDYINYLRMNEQTFNMLLAEVSPYIQKKNTRLSEAISPKQRLIAALSYLATGRSFKDMKFSMRISPQSLWKTIMETCAAITKGLNNYIQISVHLL
jgi:hypothetical protein